MGTKQLLQSGNCDFSFFQEFIMVMLILFLCLAVTTLSSPMFNQPHITKAVCDDPSFLILPDTSWCYTPNTQGPCKVGELFVSSGVGNIGECKNMRQVLIHPMIFQ